MPQLRLALNQVDVTVGDIEGNAELILRWARHAAEQGAHIAAFPEMALTGYPVEDLVLRPSFVETSRTALKTLAGRLAEAGLGGLLVVVGYLEASSDGSARLGRPAGSPQNAAAILHDGQVVSRYAKHHLPNYGVFDEYRYFVPGERLTLVRVHGVDVSVAICEDLWQDGGPVAATRAAGAGLLLVINGSPYERNKDDTRLELARKRAAEANCALAYVNMVGGQDELVFDGDSLVVAADGTLLARAPQFEEGCLLVDLTLPKATGTASLMGVVDGLLVERAVLSTVPVEPYEPLEAGIAPRLGDEAEVYQALVTGLRDYAAKNGFSTVLLGLSEGIGSALTAVIASDALGSDSVHGISMPSRCSSEHSTDDAAELAERIGLRYSVVPIEPVVSACLASLSLTGPADENLQARVRGIMLTGLSDQHGHLVLATGNKSELACGYSTPYGEAVGRFAPLKDVPETLARRLARWRNAVAEERGLTPPIPENSIVKPPGAQLRPGQAGTGALPPYELLDDILDDYVELGRDREAIIAAGFEPSLVERVLTMVDTAEYQRRLYPPGPKISPKAFGRDRRLPITNRWRETASGNPEPGLSEELAEPGVAGENPSAQAPSSR